MAQISEVVSIGGEDESDRGSRKISEKDPLMMDVVIEMSNSSGRDERGAKRARRASPSEDEPYSLSPGKFQQGGKKAKLGQERQGDTKDGLALELEATSSEQGLCPQRGESRIADESMANELEESPRAENGQQRLQPEQEKAGLAASTSSTQAEEALRSNITNRKDGKGTETISLDQENTLEEADHRDGTGIELRGGGNFLHNGGGKTNKGRGEIAVRAKGTEGLDSGVEATEWTSLREDDENPVLASLIELPARNRNKVSSTSFEGSKDNQVTNTQHAMDPEENERQSRMLLKEKVAEMTAKVEEMEQQVAEVLRMRAAVMKNKMENGRPGVNLKEHEKDRIGSTSKKQRQFEVARREAAHTKRMADLMRQFSTILRQITQHKWAWPFMRPVDVVALGLHDYFDVIKKPMDFGTIREKMNNPKEGAGYRNIQEICEDVRLVFSNAMTYNQEGTDVHIMAKTLSEKFEEKWKIVLEPKLHEEEAKRLQEQRESEAKEAAEVEAAEEATAENLAHMVCKQLVDLEDQLEDLKLQATSKCRTMSIEEKRQLGYNLGRLPPGPLNRVIQIIAKKNPDFNAAAYEVEVDIDAQDPATLWQLHCYVQMVLNPKSNDASGQIPSISRKKAHPSMAAKLLKKQDKES